MASKSPGVCPYSFVHIKYYIKKDNIGKIIGGGSDMDTVLKVAVYNFFSPFWCDLSSLQGPLSSLSQISGHFLARQFLNSLFLPLYQPSAPSLYSCPHRPLPQQFPFFLLLWDSGFHNLNWEWWEFPTAVRLDPFYQEKWQARGLRQGCGRGDSVELGCCQAPC